MLSLAGSNSVGNKVSKRFCCPKTLAHRLLRKKKKENGIFYICKCYVNFLTL